MTGFEYQQAAMRTKNTKLNTLEQLRNSAYGLNGEAGEVIDLLKKHEFQGHSLNRQELADELGDILWYIALGCDALGVSMDYIMSVNIEKLRNRYPQGFDTDRSVHREVARSV